MHGISKCTSHCGVLHALHITEGHRFTIRGLEISLWNRLFSTLKSMSDIQDMPHYFRDLS